ncbi:MAG: DUF695 domain-containing protein [Christensenellaceae bacterium]|nr:DUF695 domain-containing protein [Christensenellaceae bacterium]
MSDKRSNFFEYDWQYEQRPARFVVDMQLREQAHARPFLLQLCCQTREDAPLASRALRHIEAIQKKCEKTMDVRFAGSIQDQSRRILFFYTPAPEALEQAEAILSRERLLRCAALLREDAAWEAYDRLLYPDSAKLYTEQNRRQIALLEKHGDALLPNRRITLHLYFPAEPLLGLFIESARLAGFAVGAPEFAPEQELPYGIALHRISALTKQGLDRLTTQAIYLAAQYDGQLMSWSCPITKKSPLR